MRFLLTALLVLEVLALLCGASLLLFARGDLERTAPVAPAFRPLLDEAVIGDHVRYERRSKETGALLGYTDFTVQLALESPGQNLGREFVIEIRERPASGPGERSRQMRVRPRTNEHGFLLPLFDEEWRSEVPGGTPIIRSIATASLPMRPGKPPVRGFLVETVIPRKSLQTVAERYWMTERVPVFGVWRAEREGEILELHSMEFVGR